MTWGLGSVLAAMVAVASNSASISIDYFTQYADAYRTAQQKKKPMLVILNPSRELDVPSYSLQAIRKTEHRRELLRKYVVVVVSADSQSGRNTQRLFRARQLPRVVVIDKDQGFQIFETVRSLQGEDWNRILETFQDGDRSASLNLDAIPWCPT